MPTETTATTSNVGTCTVKDVSITTWARPERTLSSSEVDGTFERERARWQVFAFATRRMCVEPHAGSFSVKTVVRGRERYVVEGTPVVLEAGRLLLVNAGERYSSAIDQPTVAVSWFLPESLARAMPDVPAVPFRPSPQLDADRRRLLTALSSGAHSDTSTVGQCVEELTTIAVHEGLAQFRPRALDGVVRRRTRHDLLVRVSRARDYLEDHHGRDVTLDALADVASL